MSSGPPWVRLRSTKAKECMLSWEDPFLRYMEYHGVTYNFKSYSVRVAPAATEQLGLKLPRCPLSRVRRWFLQQNAHPKPPGIQSCSLFAKSLSPPSMYCLVFFVPLESHPQWSCITIFKPGLFAFNDLRPDLPDPASALNVFKEGQFLKW